MPGSVPAVTLPVPAMDMDMLPVVFVFALFVPASEGFGLGLTKNNHQVCGLGEHLPVFSRGGDRAGMGGDECHLPRCHLSRCHLYSFGQD